MPTGKTGSSCPSFRQLSENVFYWQNVKRLIIMLELINDTGMALQKAFCAKTT
jgi:hypothetical protein